jgi:hypothetical protein
MVVIVATISESVKPTYDIYIHIHLQYTRRDLNETVKYGSEFCGTATQEPLLWQGPEAIVQVNYRPILSSERVLT